MTEKGKSGGFVSKGNFGYTKSEKKRRLLITLGLFAPSVIILIISSLYYGSRMNIWTVVCVVGCLPGCRSLVNLIMLLKVKPMDRALYEEIRAHQGSLCMGYDLYMTFYEKSAYIEAIAVCGNTVCGYIGDEKADLGYMAENCQKLLRENSFKADVKFLGEKKLFLERLDSMNGHRESLEEGIRFTPDEKYPELSRNELILHTIYALCL